MIILSWNCQVLGNHCAAQVLIKLVGKKGPKVLFLVETIFYIGNETCSNSPGFSLHESCFPVQGGVANLLFSEKMILFQIPELSHLTTLILLFIILYKEHGGYLVSMATPRINVNVRHGLCYTTCIAEPLFLGFALEILMRS